MYYGELENSQWKILGEIPGVKTLMVPSTRAEIKPHHRTTVVHASVFVYLEMH